MNQSNPRIVEPILPHLDADDELIEMLARAIAREAVAEVKQHHEQTESK